MLCIGDGEDIGFRAGPGRDERLLRDAVLHQHPGQVARPGVPHPEQGASSRPTKHFLSR